MKLLSYDVHNVTESDKRAILAFSQAHTWKPVFSVATVERFLIELAKKQTPASINGFQIGILVGSIDEDLFHGQGFKKLYSTYEMENSSPTKRAVDGGNFILPANRGNSLEVYKVLCESFKMNLETSIPDEETWNHNFLSSPGSDFFLLKENDRLIAFAHLIEDQAGRVTEVRTMGVLSEHRGRGIGAKLLQYCLNQTIERGYKKSRLTVAVDNEQALGIYLKLGFKILERYQCYRTQTR